MRMRWNSVIFGLGLTGAVINLPMANAQSSTDPAPTMSKSRADALKAAKARAVARAKKAENLPQVPPRSREMKPPVLSAPPRLSPPPPIPGQPSRYQVMQIEVTDSVFKVTATPDGKEVYAVGTLVAGSFKKLKKVLVANPKAETLYIASPGGLVIEGGMAAHFIRSRAMNVTAVNLCSSSCTMILAAGKERTAQASTRIGFHKSYSPYISRYYPPEKKGLEAVSDIIFRQSYEKSGIAPDFIDKALAVPSTTLWHPPHEMMRSAGILSRQPKEKDQPKVILATQSRESIAEKLFQNPFWKNAYRANPSATDQAIDHAWMSVSINVLPNTSEAYAFQYLTDRLIVALPGLPDANLGQVAIALDRYYAKKVADGRSFCNGFESGQSDFFGTGYTAISPAQVALIIELLRAPEVMSELSEAQSLAALASLMIEVGVADDVSSADILSIGVYGGQCKTISKIYAHVVKMNDVDRARTMRGMIALPTALSKLTQRPAY
jgi:hypothetical protein